jgi:ArsR family transcriptional regulator, lead/cadmium/zinc/bismuth-responsive transcriptional repressor
MASTVKRLPPIAEASKVRQVRASLPGRDAAGDAVRVFLALANPLRLRLVHALAHTELCVGDLAHALGLSMSAVSHELRLLRHLRLVAPRDEGRRTYYRVVDDVVSELVHDCLRHVGGEPAGSRHHHPHRASRGRA